MLPQRNFVLKLFLLLFLVSSRVHAGEAWQSPDPDTSLAHFPTKLVDDLPHLFTAGNIAPFAVGSAAAALDWATLDGPNALAADLDRMNIEPLFDFGQFYGQGWVEGFGAVGSWSLGAVLRDPRLSEFGRDAAESLVDAAVLVTGLKYAVGRERPDHSDHLSFPSGHSITAFCIAPVVQKYWGWGAGVPAYLLAAVTALSRVEDYRHYLSDVIGGATLGIVIGNAVVYKPKDLSLSVVPGGMELGMRF